MEIIVLIIKVILTIVLFLLVWKVYKIFIDDIKEHFDNKKMYEKKYTESSEERNRDLKDNSDIINSTLSVSLKAAEIAIEGTNNRDKEWLETMNSYALRFENESKAIIEDVSNLVKLIIVPLGAISIIWLGHSF